VTRLLDTFLDLVRIDSPTGRENAAAEYVARVLEEAGCAVRIDDTQAATGADTGNVIAVLPATGPGVHVALSAHLDCVQPCEGVEPVLVDGIVRSAGETVLGGDDKAGLAAIIEVVRRLREADAPHAAVTVLATVSEENGLNGAKALSADDCAADLCLVLDADGPVGGIVTAAPTQYSFAATFTGRAAHAGVEPEKGVSAIRMAAAAVEGMDLGRLDAGTTANIGTIAGGRATNIVAPTCELTGECRSLDAERVEEVREAMDAAMRAAAADFGGTVDVAWKLEYRGFVAAEGSPALALVEGACRDIGIEPRRFATGGGSDGNIISAHGVPTLVLSSGMSKVHGVEEELAVVELERLADLIAAVLARAAE
jgi:tripeptide aminopeptidase